MRYPTGSTTGSEKNPAMSIHTKLPTSAPQAVDTRADDMLVILHSGSSSYVEELYRALGTVPP